MQTSEADKTSSASEASSLKLCPCKLDTMTKYPTKYNINNTSRLAGDFVLSGIDLKLLVKLAGGFLQSFEAEETILVTGAPLFMVG